VKAKGGAAMEDGLGCAAVAGGPATGGPACNGALERGVLKAAPSRSGALSAPDTAGADDAAVTGVREGVVAASPDAPLATAAGAAEGGAASGKGAPGAAPGRDFRAEVDGALAAAAGGVVDPSVAPVASDTAEGAVEASLRGAGAASATEVRTQSAS
jgi:hypothetical protein